MLRKIILSSLIVLAQAIEPSAFAGKVELTTYYPAPSGEYQTLNTTQEANFATQSGNVGIGTTNPQAKLDVNGTIRATDTSAGGCSAAADAGKMRYNSSAGVMQYCVGASGWSALGGNPSGMIAPFYLASCPAGWVLADGTNSTPDLRGAFVRGLDSGKGYDPGRVLGTYQADEFKSHKHLVAIAFSATGDGPYIQAYPYYDYQYMGSQRQATGLTDYEYGTRDPANNLDQLYGTEHNGATASWPAAITETRPKNVALIYCMKQ